MNKNKAYTGIDYFRFIASILVVAIHTSPLATYSETGDFVLSRIIARVAVPFFFMTSGFFMFSGYGKNTEKLMKLIKNTIILYITAITLYIPINIYKGYFSEEYLLSKLIRDIIFNGTLYHLWYFPALILGVCISWYFIKRFGYGRALGVCTLLYFIGLLGDNYYFVTEEFIIFKNIYLNMFHVFDYTRNGFFYAPLFITLGGLIAKEQKKGINSYNPILNGIFILMFIVEGLVLPQFGNQRHDSMYIMLIPVMYYLFLFLLKFKGERKGFYRSISLIIYIIHPMIIVVVRMVAKIIGLQRYFIKNSLIYFMLVLGISLIMAILINNIYLLIIKWRGKPYSAYPKDRAWLEIDLNNLRHNATVLHETMPTKCQLMAVVKANAYGHDSIIISEFLEDIGIKAFAVATIDEGIELRKNGIRSDILIMGYTHYSRARELHKYNLIQTVFNYNYGKQLDESGYHIKIHIKIDSGMHRLGIDVNSIRHIKNIFGMKNIDVHGIYTHLCVCDSQNEEDILFTTKQITLFYEMINNLRLSGIKVPKIHIQSSYGLMNYPNLECDYVRAGISLYGTLSHLNDVTYKQIDLRPVLSLKSRVVHILEVDKGEEIGYGRAFIANRNMRIAVLSVGYADGIPRNISGGKGKVIINGEYSSIIGRICMDQMIVDITDIQGVSINDIAIIIGKDGMAEVKVTDIAEECGSITNEVLSRLGGRLRMNGEVF